MGATGAGGYCSSKFLIKVNLSSCTLMFAKFSIILAVAYYSGMPFSVKLLPHKNLPFKSWIICFAYSSFYFSSVSFWIFSHCFCKSSLAESLDLHAYSSNSLGYGGVYASNVKFLLYLRLSNELLWLGVLKYIVNIDLLSLKDNYSCSFVWLPLTTFGLGLSSNFGL